MKHPSVHLEVLRAFLKYDAFSCLVSAALEKRLKNHLTTMIFRKLVEVEILDLDANSGLLWDYFGTLVPNGTFLQRLHLRWIPSQVFDTLPDWTSILLETPSTLFESNNLTGILLNISEVGS